MQLVKTRINYCIYPKYWDILPTYHTCLKIWNSLFYYLLMCLKHTCLKYCCMYGKQCRPWSGPTFCGIWSGFTLFAKACLSQYLGLLWYKWVQGRGYYVNKYYSYFFMITYIMGTHYPVSILCKSISGRHRPVRVADGPMTARCRFT